MWEGASYKPITIHAGFSLVWSCVDNHSDCKSMCVLVLLCPEGSVWHYPFPSTGFYSLSASPLTSLEICVGGSWHRWSIYFGHLKSHVLSTFTSSPQGYDLPSLGLLSRFTLPDMKLSSEDQASTLIRKWLVTPTIFMPRSQLWPHLPWQVGIKVYRVQGWVSMLVVWYFLPEQSAQHLPLGTMKTREKASWSVLNWFLYFCNRYFVVNNV